ncbi:MAG: phosphoribosylformylglycinamidine cyclo-ligase [Ruminococcaceae bacterium]|nr:phosphoribosylformylglycinamidine cyclo-ligase [Oscillospiraceae bacterium]
MSDSYKKAGVDVEAGYKAVELMKKHVSRTFTDGVLTGIGGFGGLFEISKEDLKNPVLVAGTDGVGTKLKLAFLLDKHDTIGQDCVAMCVNDVVCQGAKPLLFLDYVAVGKNIPEKVAEIVKGVADGCFESGCALIGGETAEMPGFYDVDEYDLAGFTVGIVDKDKIIDGSKVSDGDVIIGIASSGVHSNGYSLVRKVFNIDDGDNAAVKEYNEKLGMSIAEALLTPTKLYVKPMLDVISKVEVKAISHITGGGFYENIPRMLPEGKKAVIKKGSWKILPIFEVIAETGNIPEKDMFGTYNMGIGMMFAVDKNDVDKAMEILKNNGETAYVIGTVENGEHGVEIC